MSTNPADPKSFESVATIDARLAEIEHEKRALLARKEALLRLTPTDDNGSNLTVHLNSYKKVSEMKKLGRIKMPSGDYDAGGNLSFSPELIITNGDSIALSRETLSSLLGNEYKLADGLKVSFDISDKDKSVCNMVVLKDLVKCDQCFHVFEPRCAHSEYYDCGREDGEDIEEVTLYECDKCYSYTNEVVDYKFDECSNEFFPARQDPQYLPFMEFIYSLIRLNDRIRHSVQLIRMDSYVTSFADDRFSSCEPYALLGAFINRKGAVEYNFDWNYADLGEVFYEAQQLISGSKYLFNSRLNYEVIFQELGCLICHPLHIKLVSDNLYKIAIYIEHLLDVYERLVSTFSLDFSDSMAIAKRISESRSLIHLIDEIIFFGQKIDSEDCLCRLYDSCPLTEIWLQNITEFNYDIEKLELYNRKIISFLRNMLLLKSDPDGSPQI